MRGLAQMTKPRLIVVTGRPGSGKSTLAHELARAVRCPVICRDEIKEGLVNATGADGSDITRRAFDAFFDTVGLLIDRGVTVVAEAAFQHARWAAKLEPMLQLADVRIVVCHVDGATALARCVERAAGDPTRDRFHFDPAVAAVREGRPVRPSDYDTPRLAVPMLTVDTSDGYVPAFVDVVRFATD